MKHEQLALQLAVYRDLSGAERAQVDAHLRECAECAARLHAYQTLGRELARLPELPFDPQLRERFYSATGANGRRATGPAGASLGPVLGWMQQLAGAAVVVLVIVATWALFQALGYTNVGGNLPTLTALRTPAATVALPGDTNVGGNPPTLTAPLAPAATVPLAGNSQFTLRISGTKGTRFAGTCTSQVSQPGSEGYAQGIKPQGIVSAENSPLEFHVIGTTVYCAITRESVQGKLQVQLFKDDVQVDSSQTTEAQDSATVSYGQVATVTPPPAVARPSPTFVKPSAQFAQDANFNNRIALSGYSLSALQIKAGETLTVTLNWQALAKSDKSYTVFLHLFDRDSRLVAQQDGLPSNGRRATTTWAAGEYVVDAHALSVPSNIAPGEYRIAVGWYPAGDPSPARLPVLDTVGSNVGDSVILNRTITVEPASPLKTFTSSIYGITFDYPATWQPVQGARDYYGGSDGFFQLTPLGADELTPEQACNEGSYSKLPAAARPTLELLTIQKQTACLILQPKQMSSQSGLVISYPHPITIDGKTYASLALWVDVDHAREVAQTLRFIEWAAPTTPTRTP